MENNWCEFPHAGFGDNMVVEILKTVCGFDTYRREREVRYSEK